MALSAAGLVKEFAGVRALDNVAINLGDGEIHALLGANGSGKSTLVKVLTGVYQPDQGTITVSGRQLPALTSPAQAAQFGIAVVHQEAPLIDTMTVAESVALFRGYPLRRGRIAWDQLNAETAAMLKAHNVNVDPRTLGARLSPAERALVSVVVALDQVKAGLQLLILDEVTAPLPEKQAEAFLDHVRTIANNGTAVLMVTHRLAELRGRADRVTVLRNARVVHSGRADEVDHRQLVSMMVGPSAPAAEAASAASTADSGAMRRLWKAFGLPERGGAASAETRPVLVADHVSGKVLRDISFTLRRGEIVGIAGLTESGIGELPLILGGVTARSGGRLIVDGEDLPEAMTPRQAIDAGIGLLPVDRLRSGGIATLDLTENTLLPSISRFWHARPREREAMESVIRELDVRPPQRQTLLGKLSGGNQQKVLLAKWLSLRPRVLILEDPTSGVDPNARATMFRAMREAAEEGVAILFLSTEPDQLAAMCSRILVLRDGSIATELTGADLDRDVVSQWSYA
jgi:ribose transport system ATP-binding protein